MKVNSVNSFFEVLYKIENGKECERRSLFVSLVPLFVLKKDRKPQSSLRKIATLVVKKLCVFVSSCSITNS